MYNGTPTNRASSNTTPHAATSAAAPNARKVNPKEDYLEQCWSAVHTNQTLALDFKLSGTQENDENPVYTLHNQFSRFVLGFIDNSGNVRKIMKANIRAREIADLLEKYKLVRQKLFDWECDQTEVPEEKKLPPAYTVTIRAGEMKGKSPAEILLSDPSKVGELTRHKNWLSGFLSSFPRNQEVMDAIDEAIALLNSGELTPPDTPFATGRSMTVWRKDFKNMSNGSGTTTTGAKIAITCEFGSDNPWCFRIENCEYPITNGITDPDSPGLNRRYGTIRLNTEEMASFIYTIESLTTFFGMNEFPAAQKYVQKNNWFAKNGITPRSK